LKIFVFCSYLSLKKNMKINGLAIISIPVKDQEIAKKFYHDVFDFEIARESPFKPDAKWIELSIPGSNPGCMRVMVLLSEDVSSVGDVFHAK